MSTIGINNNGFSKRRYEKNVTIKKQGRKNRTDIRKIAGIAAVTVSVAAVGFIIYSHLPFVKVNKAIAAGNKYKESAEYQAAIDSYETAIRIDKHSVTAYSNMAGAYLSIDDSEFAKKILYDGWKITENTALLDNYHAVILNEAVSAMNNKTADMGTVSTIATVLEADNSNNDAVALLDAAYSRVFNDAYSYNADALFRSDASTYSGENGSAVFSYGEYEELINKLITIYAAAPSEDLKEVIIKYATPGDISFTMNYSDVPDYENLLRKIEDQVGGSDNISSMKLCLSDAVKVQGIFAGIFEQLDVGNVDELRRFVVSDEYLKLRDIFLNNEETPQENTTYVPISREAIVLNNNDGKWSYRFLDFEENPATKGVITLWANYFEDDGVQRNSISYEPGSVDGNYYPHTKYSVTYLYSYITSGNSTKVAKMNYRLSTVVSREDGSVEETIVGDWGGPNEWIMDIDTIESRIRA
ncbi:MAG: tetratricopeptide repeat protein [Butyrivibrio sp.]|nr:tetratricopeptide repeat protein [Butyrivibrio sp.]